MDIAIEVQNLCKRYGDFVAVDDITFSVIPGEIFGLLGPNGAGKTTTLECLEGIRRPDSGVLRVGGIDPQRAPGQLRHLIGVQLQSAGMPETITPDEALRLFSAYHDVAPPFALLDRFGLSAKRRTQFHQLSTGQQRRLALALAVAHRPAVLFLDEPTAGLDVGSRAELHRVLRELRAEGTTIILATHDMAEAEELADRVAIMLQGRLVALGSPLSLTATGAGLTKVSVRTRAGALLNGGVALPAVAHRQQREAYAIYFSSDIGRTIGAILQQVEAAGDELLDLRAERPSLEERFLELTGATTSENAGPALPETQPVMAARS